MLLTFNITWLTYVAVFVAVIVLFIEKVFSMEVFTLICFSSHNYYKKTSRLVVVEFWNMVHIGKRSFKRQKHIKEPIY